MKIITSSFYRDSARYFSFLENEIKKKYPRSSFYNISIYPCAHKFRLRKKLHSDLVAFNLNNKNGPYTIDQDEELLTKLISFHKKLYKLYDLDVDKKLKSRAVSYLNYFHHLFDNEKFDLLISSGDSRLIPECMIYIAKKKNIKIIFFEQGPFNKTIFDKRGVNANISFQNKEKILDSHEKEKLDNFYNDLYKIKKDKFYNINKKSYIEYVDVFLTYLCMYRLPILNKFMPTDLSIAQTLLNKIAVEIINKIKKNSSKGTKEYKNFILIILQVPVDAQLIEHSPYFKDFYSMLKSVLRSTPKDIKLVIREHPLYKGMYEDKIYDVLKNDTRCIIDNEKPLEELISHSSLCILNNSTVGIEALLLKKKVFTLGNSYYSNRNSGSYDFSGNIESLDDEILNALNSKLDINKVESFLYHFIFKYLFEGHYHDEDLTLDKNFFHSFNEYFISDAIDHEK